LALTSEQQIVLSLIDNPEECNTDPKQTTTSEWSILHTLESNLGGSRTTIGEGCGRVSAIGAFAREAAIQLPQFPCLEAPHKLHVRLARHLYRTRARQPSAFLHSILHTKHCKPPFFVHDQPIHLNKCDLAEVTVCCSCSVHLIYIWSQVAQILSRRNSALPSKLSALKWLPQLHLQSWTDTPRKTHGTTKISPPT